MASLSIDPIQEVVLDPLLGIIMRDGQDNSVVIHHFDKAAGARWLAQLLCDAAASYDRDAIVANGPAGIRAVVRGGVTA